MKKIVLFTGGIETQEYFSLQMAEAFKKLGCEVLLFDLQDEINSYTALSWFCVESETAMLTFNFCGIAGEKLFYDEDGTCFWDKRKVKCINYVVDHPFYYHDYIKFIPKRYYHISIDRFHKKYMEKYFPEIKNNLFLPLAGSSINQKLSRLEERSMDVVFTGNYTPPLTFDKYITRINGDYTQFYHSIIDDLLSRPEQCLEDVIVRHINRDIGEVTREELLDCMKNMIFIDLYIRFFMRGKVISTLADNGIKVHVFGKGWDLLECKHHDNIIEGGGLTSIECLEKISDAKISLNVMPWFKDGAHDRVFNTMLNGALCVSDRSVYLEEEFEDRNDIIFYNLSNIEELPNIIKRALECPKEMDEIIKSGYNKSISKHTWKNRAEIIKNL